MRAFTGIIVLFFYIACSNINQSKELYTKALTRYANKDFEGARTLCLESIKKADLPDSYLLLAKIYFFTNNPDFEKIIEKYIRLTHSSQGYILYARWFIRSHKQDEAIRYLEKALQHSPNDPVALYLLGTIQYANKQYDDAIITFHRAFANYFPLMQIHRHLQEMYSAMHMPERAAYHQAILESIKKFDDSTNGE
ncbi:MAG: tetratricopeptide repeat protein [Spirochaetota bacterium]